MINQGDKRTGLKVKSKAQEDSILAKESTSKHNSGIHFRNDKSAQPPTTMLRWYYRIKSTQRERGQAYTLDDRRCKSQLGRGFGSYLHNTGFFDVQPGRYTLPKPKRQWLRWILVIVALTVLVWVAVESALYLRQ